MTPEEHAERIRALGLPEVYVRIALEGGASVHPLLQDQADSVWAPAWSIVEQHPDLVPLWTSGTTAMLASPDGTVYWFSAEMPDEPLSSFDNLAGAVRQLLTWLWELDAPERQRREVATMLLPRRLRQAALVPIEES